MISQEEILPLLQTEQGRDGFRMALVAPDGSVCTGAGELSLSPADIVPFLESGRSLQTTEGLLLIRAGSEEEPLVLAVAGSSGSPADPGSVYKRLFLTGNAGRHEGIREEASRAVILIRTENEAETGSALEAIRSLFEESEEESLVFPMEDTLLAVVKAFPDPKGAALPLSEALCAEAEMLLDLLETEVMIRVCLGVGNTAEELAGLRLSYEEAAEALRFGALFHRGRSLFFYSELGPGRLLTHLPKALCEAYLHEVFGETLPEEPEEELLDTIATFLDNDLNVSETARRLYIHRNTLLYRIERLQKMTGYDIRRFREASDLEFALLLLRYVKTGSDCAPGGAAL